MAHGPSLRIVHTSDVHLGAHDRSDHAPDDGQREALRRVVNVANEQDADLLLVAGDFFDNARVNEGTLRFAAEQIARFEGPCLIGPGNHDHVGPGSVYDRLDLSSIAQNLTIIRDVNGETVAYDGLELEVWGRAHTEQLMHFAPFAEPPPRGEAPWQIGIGHGHFIHPDALTHHSFHIREDELTAFERDYVALGHWETMTRVASGELGHAAYSGAPDALSGTTGGYVMQIDLLEDGEVRLTALPVAEGVAPIAHDDLPLLRGA